MLLKYAIIYLPQRVWDTLVVVPTRWAASAATVIRPGRCVTAPLGRCCLRINPRIPRFLANCALWPRSWRARAPLPAPLLPREPATQMPQDHIFCGGLCAGGSHG